MEVNDQLHDPAAVSSRSLGWRLGDPRLKEKFLLLPEIGP